MYHDDSAYTVANNRFLVNLSEFLFKPITRRGQTRIRAVESSNSHSRLAWNSNALSSNLNLLNFSWESSRVFSRLARGDDSRWELKKILMRANYHELSSSFGPGFTVLYSDSACYPLIRMLLLFWKRKAKHLEIQFKGLSPSPPLISKEDSEFFKWIIYELSSVQRNDSGL